MGLDDCAVAGADTASATMKAGIFMAPILLL
jgi:hypothetical protein